MTDIRLTYDEKRFEKLRKLKKSLPERVVWEDFIYNSVAEFFKLQERGKKNGRRKKKS